MLLSIRDMSNLIITSQKKLVKWYYSPFVVVGAVDEKVD